MNFYNVNFSSSFNKGINPTLSGTIKSDYAITRVDAAIINRSTNKVVAAVCYYPNKTTVGLTDYLNGYFKFNTLPKGSYRLDITATDASKNVVPINKYFTVR